MIAACTAALPGAARKKEPEQTGFGQRHKKDSDADHKKDSDADHKKDSDASYSQGVVIEVEPSYRQDRTGRKPGSKNMELIRLMRVDSSLAECCSMAMGGSTLVAREHVLKMIARRLQPHSHQQPLPPQFLQIHPAVSSTIPANFRCATAVLH